MDSRALVRIEQARLVVEDAHAEVSGWLTALAAVDGRGHHASHRAVLGRLADQTRALLTDGLTHVAADAPDAACRRIEGTAAAVRRLARGFEPLLGQRLDARRRPVLLAADELVWSLVGGRLRPPPVTFLDARAAPDAVPVVRFDRRDAELAPLLDRLGDLVLPLVRLPAHTQAFALLPLAHELGHHLLLGQGFAWLADLQTRLAAAAGEDWRQRAEELFADAFSVVALGPWALTALLDHVRDVPAAMAAAQSRSYPPALARLGVMAAVWRGLDREGRGWSWPLAPHLAGLSLPDDPTWATVANVLLAPLAGGASLAALTPFATDRLHPDAPGFRAWRDALLGAGPLPVSHDADALDARVAACAARAAFDALPAPGDAARPAALARLATRAAEGIAACSPDGERASAGEVTDFKDVLGEMLHG